MQILAHRGFWKTPDEKNSIPALSRALSNGFGLETDLRDYQGRLVISHNVADENSPLAEILFQQYRALDCTAPLALNVKADGIQTLVQELLKKYDIRNYFLFDMSIPELIVNEARQLRYFTRHSDVEAQCVMYARAAGVWMDSFYQQDWLTPEAVSAHLEVGKQVCIVSPELHGWQQDDCWARLKDASWQENDAVLLCTDYPDLAKEYFYGKD